MKRSSSVIAIFFTLLGHFAATNAQAQGARPTHQRILSELDLIPPSWSQTLPAIDRFELVMGNAAVLDRETGLVWERSPDTDKRDWFNAGIRCLTKTVANRKGWRLPTVQELASLQDGTLLPAGHPFLNVQNDIYWSASTTAANGPALAWFVSFADGHIANIFKTVTYNFWCVRGGQAVDPQ